MASLGTAVLTTLPRSLQEAAFKHRCSSPFLNTFAYGLSIGALVQQSFSLLRPRGIHHSVCRSAVVLQNTCANFNPQSFQFSSCPAPPRPLSLQNCRTHTSRPSIFGFVWEPSLFYFCGQSKSRAISDFFCRRAYVCVLIFVLILLDTVTLNIPLVLLRVPLMFCTHRVAVFQIRSPLRAEP